MPLTEAWRYMSSFLIWLLYIKQSKMKPAITGIEVFLFVRWLRSIASGIFDLAYMGTYELGAAQ